MGNNLPAKKVRKLQRIRQNKFDRVLARNIAKHGDNFQTKGMKAQARIDKDEEEWRNINKKEPAPTKKQIIKNKVKN